MKKSAFTLIELLVVIAIIAILASLAIPAYTKIMERGRATQDANNLKQIGLAAIAYMNDNDDVIVGGTTTGWAGMLNPKYIPSWRSFQSPFDTRTASESGTSATNTSPVSYDVNFYLSGSNSSSVVSPSSCVFIGPVYPSTQKFTLTAITAKGNLKSDSNVDNTNPQYGGVYNNRKLLNVLFADSHVAIMKGSDFCDKTNQLSNSDKTATVQNLRWNSP